MNTEGKACTFGQQLIYDANLRQYRIRVPTQIYRQDRMKASASALQLLT